MVETAHIRALQEARQAEKVVAHASDGLAKSRTCYLGAHTRAEALRKAVQTRRAEAVRAEAQAEQKGMDEIAMLLRVAVA
jgi:flagellar biosynthesis chaperone FliJ